jgi:hypothetical protein
MKKENRMMMIDRRHWAPEQYDPELLEPSKRKVLVLASYCGDDNEKCSDDIPCVDCLLMSNVAEVKVGVEHIVGCFDGSDDRIEK